MTKKEIIHQLEIHYTAFLAYISKLPEKQYLHSHQHKWTAGQQLEHLIKSVDPLVKFYSMSPQAIEHMFGKTNRTNQSYKQLTANYQKQLAAGGKAPNRFLPTPSTFDQRGEGLNQLSQLVHQLIDNTSKQEEAVLESHLIPHPLLGNLTLKEMLYNAIYHVQHHHQQTVEHIRPLISNYHLAQINIARMKGVNIDDPVMKEFVDNLEHINQIAEASEGFVWRMQDEENNATSFNPYNDEQVIVNVSVWESIEALKQYVFRSPHADFMRRRKEWFQKFGTSYTAMWWIEADTTPSIEEAVAKLDVLQQNGASEGVFDFSNTFPPPMLLT